MLASFFVNELIMLHDLKKDFIAIIIFNKNEQKYLIDVIFIQIII